MIINEIFYSLQGEGFFAGVPSVFVRLAGCPLKCRWCDTKYARGEKAGKKMSVDEVMRAVLEFEVRHIVITGGEPMVNSELPELLDELADPCRHITIETSGIVHVAGLKCDLMSISPKLANTVAEETQAAGEHEHIRFDPSVIENLIASYDYQLKFVVDASSDLDDIAGCIQKLENVNPYKIMLMPQAATSAEYVPKLRMVAEICKNTGFALSPRLHILLWNTQRGK